MGKIRGTMKPDPKGSTWGLVQELYHCQPCVAEQQFCPEQNEEERGACRSRVGALSNCFTEEELMIGEIWVFGVVNYPIPGTIIISVYEENKN